MLGLFRDHAGNLHRKPSPYVGGKILAGASAEKSCLRSKPKDRKAQYHGCNVKPVDDKKWEDIVRRLLHLEKIFALGIGKENSHLTSGSTESGTPDPEQFLWSSQPAAWKGTINKKPLLDLRRGF